MPFDFDGDLRPVEAVLAEERAVVVRPEGLSARVVRAAAEASRWILKER
jgi:hypothetical protein